MNNIIHDEMDTQSQSMTDGRFGDGHLPQFGHMNQIIL